MNTDSIKFEIKENNIVIYGHPELEGSLGYMSGDDMAFFFREFFWDRFL